MLASFATRLVQSGIFLLAMPLSGCSALVVAADVAVSAGVTVVGTAADIAVAGVKAVTGGSSDETKKAEKR